MPYKNYDDRRSSKREYERRKRNARWESLGFTVTNPEATHPEVVCNDCGKASPATTAHIYKHEKTCIKYVEYIQHDRRKGARSRPDTDKRNRRPFIMPDKPEYVTPEFYLKVKRELVEAEKRAYEHLSS